MKNIENYDINNRIKSQDSVAHYYQKKEDVNFVLTNEQTFMRLFFWDRVHEHITSSTTLPNNGYKYNICQVKEKNDSSKYVDVNSSNVFVKESRFSYIRPVDGATRLIVYNCSNI